MPTNDMLVRWMRMCHRREKGLQTQSFFIAENFLEEGYSCIIIDSDNVQGNMKIKAVGYKMKYCFVREDLEKESHSLGQFGLQARYAKALGCVCFCDLKSQKIVSADGNGVDVHNETVCLRSSLEHVFMAQQILENAGAHLLETKEDMERIENWVELGIHRREIRKIAIQDLLEKNVSESLPRDWDKLFLKSFKKSFSISCTREELQVSDGRVAGVLREYNETNEVPVLMSKYFVIETDSLGKKEARFVVRDHEIVAGSRYLWGLMHNVPQQLKDEAKRIVAKLAEREFVKNYVLDLAVFRLEKETFVDVVELNPFTTSWCYVNNSIFVEEPPILLQGKGKVSYGNEFLYDSLKRPQWYHKTRQKNVQYELSNENRYHLIEENG